MSTHSLTVADGLVVKRFLAHARGEPEREWRALTPPGTDATQLTRVRTLLDAAG